MLRERLSEAGAVPFRTERETATGPKIVIPEDIDSLFQQTVDGALKELQAVHPDRRHMVTASLNVGDPYERGSSQLQKWLATTQELHEEETLMAVDFVLIGGTPTYIEPVYYMLPEILEGKSPWGFENNILRRYHPDYVVVELDVAGNEVPIGVRGYADLRFYIERGEEPVTLFSTLAMVMSRLSLLGLLLLIVTPPVWVYMDARRRRLPAALWGLFALPTSVLGALVYSLVTRDVGPVCPECGERISTRFVVCPYCQTELKGTCPTCGQTVGLSWNYCPSCSTEL